MAGSDAAPSKLAAKAKPATNLIMKILAIVETEP
jgi:hypothetical protein